jgi:hypothetical protein
LAGGSAKREAQSAGVTHQVGFRGDNVVDYAFG